MNPILIKFLKYEKVQRILRSRPGDEGFSLVELVVVIAVLAVLSAIAIPAFQGVQKSAQMSAVKNGLVNGVKECVVSAAVNVGEAGAEAYDKSQAFKGDYSGYTITPTGASCYGAFASPTDTEMPWFSIQYDGTSGVATKQCLATKKGCPADGTW